jgi:hypothetical protein
LIHYVYDLDGFTYTEDDAWVFQGSALSTAAALETKLQDAGWEVMLRYGRYEGNLVIYKHRDGIERGLYADIRDVSDRVYTCLVMPRAWPQFYRTELLPTLQSRSADVIAACTLSLYTSTTAMAAGLTELVDAIKAMKPPKVTRKKPPKEETPPVVETPPVTPPIVTPPGQDKDKTK